MVIAGLLVMTAILLILFRGLLADHAEDPDHLGRLDDDGGASSSRRIDRNDAAPEVVVPRDGNINDLDSSFSLFDDDGNVTSYALELVGLEYDDAKTIEAIRDKAWEELGDLFVNNSHFIDEESSPDEGIYVYRISAFPGDGDVVLESMMKDFQAAFGKQAASLLGGGLHTWRYFGNFGRLDIKFRMEPNVNRRWPSETRIYKFDMFDPRTGDRIGSASYYKRSDVRENFGDAPGRLEANVDDAVDEN